MPSTDSPSITALRPTPELPLQGITLLVVEDSRYACEALRLMALRSGARMRRAGSLHDARAHLRVYRPDIALVDIGLPDGSGTGLIRELALDGGPVTLGLSGDPGQRGAALAAGAKGFVEKPIAGLAVFQHAILRHLTGHDLRAVAVERLEAEPDRLALAEDLAHAAGLLAARPDARTRAYLARFLAGLARSTQDPALARAADRLHDADETAVAHLGGLVALRLGEAPPAFG